jgi:hypothetical protein
MPEDMGCTPARASDTSSVHRSGNDHRYRTVVCKGAIRRVRPEEQGFSVGRGVTILEIGDDGVAHLLSQGQQCLTTAFPCDADAGLLPVDVVQTKLNDVARAQTQASEKEENRAVPRANRSAGVT